MKDWLAFIDLDEEYANLFQQEGYENDVDIPNMKRLDEHQLKSMGIIKRC